MTVLVNVFHLGSSSLEHLVNPPTNNVVNNYYGNYLESANADTIPSLSIVPRSRNKEASVRVTNNSGFPVSVVNRVTIRASTDGKAFINQGVLYGAPWLGSVSDVKTIPNGASENVSVVKYGSAVSNLAIIRRYLPDYVCFNFMASEHWLQYRRDFFSLGCREYWFWEKGSLGVTYSMEVTLTATSVVNPYISTTVTKHYTDKYDPVSMSPIIEEENAS